MSIKLTVKRLFKQFGLLDNSIYRLYSGYMSKRAEQKRFNRDHPLLVKYGSHVLNILFNNSDFKNIPIWIEYGTLLGAIRNGRFIPHDIDIDMGLNLSDYTDELQEKLVRNGFVKKHAFYLIDHKNGTEYLSEVAYDYHGLNIDFFISSPQGDNKRANYVYSIYDRDHPLPDGRYRYKVMRMITPNVVSLETVLLEEVECKIPQNTHSYLRAIYGDNYMTPIVNWSPKSEKTVREFLDVSEYEGRIVKYQ